MTGRRLLSAVLLLASSAITLSADGPFAFVQVSSKAQRRAYLASARIWTDPGPLTPDDVFAGPRRPGVLPAGDGAATISCQFARPGASLGGATPKFLCRPSGGAGLRVKYTDGTSRGNREVYALVVATRLLWVLGFSADPIFPVTIDCQDCPADPMTGAGTRAARRYLAIYQPSIDEPVLVAGTDPNEGWSWAELDEAITALPPGPDRDRQRAHFDALTLAGVLLQHGDRKPEQQRLSCGGPIDRVAGDIHPMPDVDEHGYHPPVFFEHEGARACADPVVTVQDVGATLGGAGRTSNARTAKLNLRVWASRRVFLDAAPTRDGSPAECRGNLTVSLTAGGGGRGRPRIGEAGRQFFLAQAARLTDTHLRALLRAARVDQIEEEQVWRDPRTGQSFSGIDAWVAAFKDKVGQIASRSCAP